MSTAPYGMLLDRGLTLEQLDLALEVSRADPNPATNRRALTIALRDLVSDQEAEGKTKKCLTRVWLNPPPPAAQMIAWARAIVVVPSSRSVVHYGAILATFPFAGVVARSIGRRFQLDGRANAADVRNEVRREVGDRSSVDVAARKAYTAFRNIGVIDQTSQTLRPVPALPDVPAVLGTWFSHALLLTRQAEALPITSLQNAPELLGIQLPAALSREYAFLEFHSEMGGLLLAHKEPRAW
jgi:hypothetical protein